MPLSVVERSLISALPMGGPTGADGECSVVAEGDAIECGLRLGGVDCGLEKSGGGFVLRVVQGDQASPGRGDGRGAYDDQGLSVDADRIAGGGIGIVGHAGHAATHEGSGCWDA